MRLYTHTHTHTHTRDSLTKKKGKISKKRKDGEPIVINLNLSLTIIKTILMIAIITLITAQATLTIIKTNKQKNLEANQESEEKVKYVASKKIDENREEILDSEGNPIDDTRMVPIPAGYTASQVPGERSIDTGFVIYEGEINWSDYIVDETSTVSEYNIKENSENDTYNTTNNRNNNLGEKEEFDTNETNLEEKQESSITMLQEGIVDNTTSFQNETVNTVVQESNIQEEAENHSTKIEKTESQTEENNSVNGEENRKEEQKKIDTTQLENESQIELKEYEITKKEAESIETTSMKLSTYANEITQTDINIFNLQKNVNQYVWVPISEYELEEIYGVDSNGKLWGKLYDSYNPTTTHSTSGLNWNLLEDGIMSIVDKIGSREPDVTRNEGDSNYRYDFDSQLSKEVTGETRYELLSKELEQDFYKTIESIKKYGGFYIGRYETGGTGVVRKMDYNSNGNSWYGLYKTCNTLKGENNNVRTSMIWGSLWDATLRWVIASEEKVSNGIKINNTYLTNYNYAKYLGNYYYSTFDYIATNANKPLYDQKKVERSAIRVATGSTEHAKINNIYDMAGNVFDYTLESNRTNARVPRGACYNNVYGEQGYPSHRNIYGPSYNDSAYFATRSVMYIQ